MSARLFAAAAAAALMTLAAGVGLTPAPVLAQSTAPPPDALTDPSFKAADVISFMGLRSGDKVADIVAGRFVRALSKAVGPAGKVYAVEPAEVVKLHPQGLAMLQGLAAMPDYRNVEVTSQPIGALALPTGLDAVFIRQNYHDLHDPFMGPADVPAFNRAIFAALRPGGAYVVLDHAAEPGSGLRDTNTLHRIDAAAVKSEVTAAGFVFAGESQVLRNPADDHTKNVFDKTLRGHTDQFLYKFYKPR